MSGEGAQEGPLQQYLSMLWTTGTHITHTLIHSLKRETLKRETIY